MKNKKIIITGGTGFVAQSLARYFGKENKIVLLSRDAVKGVQNNNYARTLVQAGDGYNVTYWRWDGHSVEKHWLKEMEGADVIINLAGKTVNCRYTERNKNEILQSRIKATEVIGEAIRQCVHPPKLWINASSATIYRNEYERANDEKNGIISALRTDNMPYTFPDRFRQTIKKCWYTLRYGKNAIQSKKLDLDFSVEVCQAWEKSFFNQRTAFTRKVALRSAITFGEGGVLIPYFRLLKFGLGGKQGPGHQYYSWIHCDDLAAIVAFLYEQKELEGVFNAAAPEVITNNELMSCLRKLTGKKRGLNANTWLPEAGAALIGTETELILKSRWVKAARLEQSGFRFQYPTLESALQNVLSRTDRKEYTLS